jgi:hypothetical protein
MVFTSWSAIDFFTIDDIAVAGAGEAGKDGGGGVEMAEVQDALIWPLDLCDPATLRKPT